MQISSFGLSICLLLYLFFSLPFLCCFLSSRSYPSSLLCFLQLLLPQSSRPQLLFSELYSLLVRYILSPSLAHTLFYCLSHIHVSFFPSSFLFLCLLPVYSFNPMISSDAWLHRELHFISEAVCVCVCPSFISPHNSSPPYT